MSKKRCILILILFLGLCASCISIDDYAIKYRALANPGPGFTPSKELVSESRETFKQLQTQKEKDQHMERFRCKYLRNQLAIASETAQEHRLWIWLFPAYWPLHLLTFYTLPISETQNANWVIRSAQQLELAYQTDDEVFLSKCKNFMDEKVIGQSFSKEVPALTKKK